MNTAVIEKPKPKRRTAAQREYYRRREFALDVAGYAGVDLYELSKRCSAILNGLTDEEDEAGNYEWEEIVLDKAPADLVRALARLGAELAGWVADEEFAELVGLRT